MTDLRPCPFCGGKAKLHTFKLSIKGNHYYVECDNDDCPVCPGTANKYTEEEAITVWNTRYSDKESKGND